jgi:hypothetical protein
MARRNYNKYTSIPDRFPFIILALILIFAVIFMFQFKAKYPLAFFTRVDSSITSSHPMLVVSPVDGKVFSFVNQNEYVPIEIKSKQIEDLNNTLNIVANGKDIIKTFNSAPYKYDWQSIKAGKYTIIAFLLDDTNKIISSSNEVNFEVRLKYEEETIKTEATTEPMKIYVVETSVNIAPIIKLKIFEGPIYSAGDDICYYRVRAVATGNPTPLISFSKDDSKGAWGSSMTQINLTRAMPSYELIATAKNSIGQSSDSLILNWGCE